MTNGSYVDRCPWEIASDQIFSDPKDVCSHAILLPDKVTSYPGGHTFTTTQVKVPRIVLGDDFAICLDCILEAASKEKIDISVDVNVDVKF